MRILVNSQEMKQCDTNTIERRKVPSLVLMERAALGVVEEISSRSIDSSRCLVVCGLGNNGGDGMAVARLLHQRGSDVTVVCDWKPEKATEQTRAQYEMLKAYEIPIVPRVAVAMGEKETAQITSGSDSAGVSVKITPSAYRRYPLIIDAIFGIGLSREIEGHWCEEIMALNAMEGYKVAVDIPSGIHGDDGRRMGCAFRADLTVTFAYEKTGLLLYPGCEYAGEVAVRDIGIDRYSWFDAKPTAYAYEDSDISRMPERRARSNKGTYGKVLVVAGKHNMAGAAYFSGKAAVMTGCGLVKIFTTEENRTIIQQLLPEAILETWTADETEQFNLIRDSEGNTDGQDTSKVIANRDDLNRRIGSCVSWADVIVLGPGLGTDSVAEAIVTEVLQRAACPVIADADALNLLAKNPQPLRIRQGRTILTPHMGEMARLTGKSIEELSASMVNSAAAVAKEYRAVCVLKDARTVTALPDGTYYVNTSGNNGMSTAGAGDVLTGIIAGLIAQGMIVEEAAPLGVYLHGRAGDAIAGETGCYSMMASDIIEGIRRITKAVTRKEA